MKAWRLTELILALFLLCQLGHWGTREWSIIVIVGGIECYLVSERRAS